MRMYVNRADLERSLKNLQGPALSRFLHSVCKGFSGTENQWIKCLLGDWLLHLGYLTDDQCQTAIKRWEHRLDQLSRIIESDGTSAPAEAALYVILDHRWLLVQTSLFFDLETYDTFAHLPEPAVTSVTCNLFELARRFSKGLESNDKSRTAKQP